MKKLFLGVVLALMLVATVAIAVPPADKATKATNVMLYAKTPGTDIYNAWEIVLGGAWGKLNYDNSKFVFNGHGLVTGLDYSLISYEEPGLGNWPADVVILGSGTADEFGDVHIMGLMQTPYCNDYTGYPTDAEYYNQHGAKIWLVLSSDLTGTQITGWTPTSYLFEDALINVGCGA
ncbi:MAG: hypothetical protein V1702_02040 [Candidatus Woesearchaeota archaeon]